MHVSMDDDYGGCLGAKQAIASRNLTSNLVPSLAVATRSLCNLPETRYFYCRLA